MRIMTFALCAVCIFAGTVVRGAPLVAPTITTGEREVGAGLMFNEKTSYELGRDTFTTTRNYLWAYGSYRDFFVALGTIPSVEYAYDDEGDGFWIAVGARRKVWEEDNLSVHLYGQLSYQKEEKEDGFFGTGQNYQYYEDLYYEKGAPDTADISITQLIIGGACSYALSDQLRIEGGIEFLAHEDAKVAPLGFDLKTSSAFNLRGGISYTPLPWKLSAGLYIGDRTGIQVSAGYAF